MKNRSRAFIRHQRARVIKKKLKILQNVFFTDDMYLPVRGKLSKGKIHCSCKMCRYEQYHSIPKAKHKVIFKALEQEMNDYIHFEESSK